MNLEHHIEQDLTTWGPADFEESLTCTVCGVGILGQGPSREWTAERRVFLAMHGRADLAFGATSATERYGADSEGGRWMTKDLKEITDHEWIQWQWREVTSMSSTGRMFSRGNPRTPEEGALAAREVERFRQALAKPERPVLEAEVVSAEEAAQLIRGVFSEAIAAGALDHLVRLKPYESS